MLKDRSLYVQSLKNIGSRIWRKFGRRPDRFLSQVTGVVHVGANKGQERRIYERHGLRVIWIEPIPRVFEILKSNLKGFPDQRAIHALITDKDDEECRLNIANNDGQSSSIFEFKGHRDIWPNVKYTETVVLKTTTLEALFKREGVNPDDFQALILDTQGSELLVLRGGVSLLGGFQFVKTEAADFESYAGCCQLRDIEAFMKAQGYIEISRDRFASGASGGGYYDVLYKRAS